MADSRAPIREERPSAMKPAAPVMAAREKDVPPVSAEALGDPALLALLRQAELSAPSFTIRGGANEILRGVIAKAIGLR